ncbi:hypothetical protein [Paraburkholderia sp. RL17-373-BIF-A]|uniref:hypothetical protein n=1 Tax=Paraburkholderia sp. RL17-373-BIF-A TaxID=3031629 RepID=UPI0038BC3361
MILSTRDLTMSGPNLGGSRKLRVAEATEDVDRTVGEHFAQLKERLFRGVIGGHNLSSNLIGFVRNLCRGLDAHTAYLREQTGESSKVRLIVLKRVDIATQRILDELLIEVLPAHAVARKPLLP